MVSAAPASSSRARARTASPLLQRCGGHPCPSGGCGPTAERERRDRKGARARHGVQTSVARDVEVTAPDDPTEAEADRVAERVMRMPEPAAVASGAPERVARECSDGRCDDDEEVQRAIALISARVKAGMARARAQGRRISRPPLPRAVDRSGRLTG